MTSERGTPALAVKVQETDTFGETCQLQTNNTKRSPLTSFVGREGMCPIQGHLDTQGLSAVSTFDKQLRGSVKGFVLDAVDTA